MKFIGITGGVGAGKSAVLDYIRDNYNCVIYPADNVAHLLYEKGTDCYEKIVSLLSEKILDEEGNIDKKKMAGAIFEDESLLTKINDIVHPAVREFLLNAFEEAKESGKYDFFFVEAALLIEAGYKGVVDELWYVYADPEVRRKRLKESRGYDDAKIDSILSNQLSDEEFRKNCDVIIDNSGELSYVYGKIDKLLEGFKGH
ncbi:MAG: dephospho-CoA kinase [Lachnospiraceae bacterium]|nr:dephospho-CoA kinase [Lachnospiraceae bacterium]